MPIDLSDLETDYRASNYRDSKVIKKKKIVCSSCGTDLGTKLGKPGAVFVHPFTSTLQCKKCKDFYGDGCFSMDEDGDDKYCRICGNGGKLYICGNKPCPYGFCLKCIERYIGTDLKDVEADDWKCLHCNCKPLWEARAICAVVIKEHTRNRRKYNKKPTRAEVYESDDNRSLSEDIDSSYEKSKTMSRHRLRSKHLTIKKNTHLQRLKQICDSSDDSSIPPKPYKPVARKVNLNVQSSSESGSNSIRVPAKKKPESKRGKKRKHEESVSSENENTDPPEEPKLWKTRTNAEVKMEQKLKKKKFSENSNRFLAKQKEIIHSIPKDAKLTKPQYRLTTDSDSSNQTSAEDFVRSKKKRLFKKLDDVIKPKKKLQSNKVDISESVEETSVFDVPPRQNIKSASCETKSVERSKRNAPNSSENTETREKISSRSGSDTELRQTFPLSKRRQQTLFSLNNDDGMLNKKKLSIKQSYAKVASTKDYVKKNQAKVIRNCTLKLIRDIDKLGRALSIGASRIAKKHLTNNFTKVGTVSKSVLKCALLMNRCKKDLNRIDHEFMECYNDWCKNCKVHSILSDLEDAADLASSSDEESSIIKRKPVDTNEINESNRNSESQEETTDNVTNSKIHNNVAETVSGQSNIKSSNNNVPIKSKNGSWKLSIGEKPVVSSKNSDSCKSPEKNQQVEVTPATEQVEKTDSDCNLKNSDHNIMSEFDSDEIFSGDESRAQSKKVDVSRSRNSSGGSCSREASDEKLIRENSDNSSEKTCSPKTSNKATNESMESRSDDFVEKTYSSKTPMKASNESTESNSNDRVIQKEDDAKSSKSIREKSPDLIDSVTNVSNLSEIREERGKQDSINRTSLELANESSEKSLVKGSTKNPELLDSSLEDIFHEASSTSNIDDKFMDCKSVISNSEVAERNKTLPLTPLPDDESTIEIFAAPSSDELNLLCDLSENVNECDEGMSDCEREIIFTQSALKVASSDSKGNYLSNGTKLAESLTIKSEVNSDTGKQVLKDIEYANNETTTKKAIAKPLKTSSPLKPLAEETEDVADVNESKKTKKSNTIVVGRTEEIGSQNIEGEPDTSTEIQDKLKNGKIIETNIESPCNEEKKSENNIVESEKQVTEQSHKKQTSIPESDTAEALFEMEEAMKRKMLESDSELSDSSTEQCLNSKNFRLRFNSDSDDDMNQLDSTHSNSTVVTSDQSNFVEKLENVKGVDKKCEQSSSPSADEKVDLNEFAKKRLLSSSNSSSSDLDTASVLRSFQDSTDSDTTSKENVDTSTSSILNRKSTSSIRSKVKKNKLILEENLFYKTDKKLQMNCEVIVRRLNEKVLDQFRQLLDKSKERQESKKFKSLVDLNTVNKRKRGTCDQSGSSSDSSSSKVSSKERVKKTKPKQLTEKEATLLDFLDKMKNGENELNFSADETEENNENPEIMAIEVDNIDEHLIQANEAAKDLLNQSSDSENEIHASIDDTEQEEVEDTQPKIKKDKHNKNETEDPGSNHENGSNAEKSNDEDAEKDNDEEEDVAAKESDDSDSDRTLEKKKMKEMLAKRNWTLTDSDSSTDQKKWDKSQSKEKKQEKDPEMGDENKDKDNVKRKNKTKRRVLGSDSDSVKLTDESDSSVEDVDEEKKEASDSEDSAELFDNLRKKRRKKRNATEKSNSDSESEQDDKPVKQKRKRIKHVETDSDSNNDGMNSSRDTQGKLHRKNIRPVLKSKQVADVTKIAGKEEEERLKRIAERQKLYNEMYEIKLASEAKVDKLVLDFDEETKKELISVHEDLVKRLKPHQAQGIKFMWDACFESLERTKTEKGSGCIVAHCMGLGKTFQVVTLAHTLLTHPETGIKTVMVVCPLSTVLNWVNEFKKWLGDINNGEDVEVYEMTKMKKNFERKHQLEKWKRTGGVMILGYEMFRLLSNQKGKKMRKSLHEAILKCLLNPGPDLIVCDEGHLLKNEDTALSKAMRRVNTLRRIVLTGTPLQNNLVEYHCMVQFVKPNLLGTKKEFSNRFVNPITNGQFDDSTEYDVKLMKKRAHVLHKMLEGSVQRFDYSVLTPFLPPKQEYVITVRLADIQIKLYQYYIDNFSRKTVGSGTSLFADFQSLQRIWTHPIVLRMNAEKMERINEKKRLEASDSEGSLRDFLDDGSEDRTTTTSDSDIQSLHGSSDEKTEKPRRGTRANPIDLDAVKSEEEEAPQAGEWWSQFVEPEHFEDLRISSKLVLLFAILKESEQIGDKVLVFSQSLYALSLIEEFLSKIDDETQRGTCSELIDGHTGSWSLGLDYFRLDGQTAPENRSQYCKIFNNPKNSRARLFLISTRAGGLGINLTAANRVIIFDASWNPSHDVQSIFRIYRFGQRKPCYVYRFLAQGTMEEKIYNRQVTKLSLSCRVVDEQQIERHYSNHDLAELYQFEPNTNKEKPTLNLPKDRLLAEIFRKYEDRIETFHEHDSLLENKAEEELDEEERKEAWKEYEDERMGRKMYMNNFNNQNYLTQQYNEMLHANQAEIANRATLSGINIENLEALIRKDYPNATPEHQKAMTARTILELYSYMENETIRQQHLAAAASSFTYPTVSNFNTNTVDKNVMTPAQRQYVFQQQQQQQLQQQQLQQMLQREQQANYAKRFGNVRIPAIPATSTRPPQVVDLQSEENDVVEVPTTVPAAAATTAAAASAAPASSSVQVPAASATPENSKKQEE